jgi:hypothetical protein
MNLLKDLKQTGLTEIIQELIALRQSFTRSAGASLATASCRH